MNVKFPFLTRGQPPRCGSMRDIYLSRESEVDIPDIPLDETEVAFRTLNEFHFTVRGGAEFYEKIPGGIELRLHDGRLFRPVGTPGWLRQADLNNAFTSSFGGAEVEEGSNFSIERLGERNPLSAALARQFNWELERESASDSRIVTAWPGTSKGRTRHASREATDFAEVALHIIDEDLGMSERSLSMIETQARRLICIDGVIWMACSPPCIRVDLVEDVHEIYISVTLATAYDGLDPLLYRRDFRLDDMKGAMAYAEKCVWRKPGAKNIYTINQLVPDYEVLVHDAVELDADGKDLARIGYTLASECARYRRKNSSWLDGRLNDSLDAAIEEVRQTNYVLETFGDVTPYVEDLCAIWKSFNRPTTFCEVGPDRIRFGNMLTRRALELADNVPISFPAQPMSGAVKFG